MHIAIRKMNLHIIKSLYNYKLFGSKIDVSQQLNLTCTSWLHPIPDWIWLAGSCRRSISQIVVWVARVRNCFPVSVHRSRHHSIRYSTGVTTCDFLKIKKGHWLLIVHKLLSISLVSFFKRLNIAAVLLCSNYCRLFWFKTPTNWWYLNNRALKFLAKCLQILWKMNGV